MAGLTIVTIAALGLFAWWLESTGLRYRVVPDASPTWVGSTQPTAPAGVAPTALRVVSAQLDAGPELSARVLRVPAADVRCRTVRTPAPRTLSCTASGVGQVLMSPANGGMPPMLEVRTRSGDGITGREALDRLSAVAGLADPRASTTFTEERHPTLPASVVYRYTFEGVPTAILARAVPMSKGTFWAWIPLVRLEPASDERAAWPELDDHLSDIRHHSATLVREWNGRDVSSAQPMWEPAQPMWETHEDSDPAGDPLLIPSWQLD